MRGGAVVPIVITKLELVNEENEIVAIRIARNDLAEQSGELLKPALEKRLPAFMG